MKGFASKYFGKSEVSNMVSSMLEEGMDDSVILEEAIGNKNFARAEKLILKFISKKMGKKYVRFGGDGSFVSYKSSKDSGVSIRYVRADGKIGDIRLNWSVKVKSREVTSVDFFGKKSTPIMRINTHGISLVKILPEVVELLKARKPNKKGIPVVIEEQRDVISEVNMLEEQLANEQAEKYEMLEEAIKGGSIEKGEPENIKVGNTIYKDMDELRLAFPKKKDLVMVLAKANYNIAEVVEYAGVSKEVARQSFRAFAESSKMTPDKSGRFLINITADAGVPEIEMPTASLNSTLSPLEKLVQARLSKEYSLSERIDNATKDINHLLSGNGGQSLILAGLPGVSKTVALDQALEEGGHSEGTYARIIGGRMSYAPLYKLLWEYRKGGLIVLDDLDSVLLDGEMVGLLKGALDEKTHMATNGVGNAFNYKKYQVTDDDLEIILGDHIQFLVKSREYGYSVKHHKMSKKDVAEINEELAQYSMTLDDIKTSSINGVAFGTMPQSFDFYGKVIFLTNLPRQKLDTAFISRSIVVEIFPKPPEIFDFIENNAQSFVDMHDGSMKPTIPEVEQVMSIWRPLVPDLATGVLDLRQFAKTLKIRMTNYSSESIWKTKIEEYITDNMIMKSGRTR